ncbi:MAG TPA: hypothetical protein VFL28_07345 [bacterium]|nr:hypothetical protein [bacterium]
MHDTKHERITELHYAVEDALVVLAERDGGPGPTYYLLPSEDVRRLVVRLSALRPDDVLEAVLGWLAEAARHDVRSLDGPVNQKVFFGWTRQLRETADEIDRLA